MGERCGPSRAWWTRKGVAGRTALEYRGLVSCRESAQCEQTVTVVSSWCRRRGRCVWWSGRQDASVCAHGPGEGWMEWLGTRPADWLIGTSLRVIVFAYMLSWLACRQILKLGHLSGCAMPAPKQHYRGLGGEHGMCNQSVHSSVGQPVLPSSLL